MPVCTKMISSVVKKILDIARVNISPGTILGAVPSATLPTGISLVIIPQAGDWTRVSNPTRIYISGFSTMSVPGP